MDEDLIIEIMKYLVLLFLVSTPLHSFSQQADKFLSSQMYDCQMKTDSLNINYGTFNDRNKENVLRQERCNLFQLDALSDFLASDTLFFIESYCKGFIEGQIWNKKGEKILYAKNTNEATSEFNFVDSNLFSDKLVSLVSTWNIEAIQQEIEKSEVIITPATYCYLTRIIRHGNKVNDVECLSFILNL